MKGWSNTQKNNLDSKDESAQKNYLFAMYFPEKWDELSFLFVFLFFFKLEVTETGPRVMLRLRLLLLYIPVYPGINLPVWKFIKHYSVIPMLLWQTRTSTNLLKIVLNFGWDISIIGQS